jgi:hypothetical protein
MPNETKSKTHVDIIKVTDVRLKYYTKYIDSLDGKAADFFVLDLKDDARRLALDQSDLSLRLFDIYQLETRLKQKRTLVALLPGQKGFDILGRFTSKKNRDQILNPTRADDCAEYQSAFIRNDLWALRYWSVMMQVRPLAVLFYAKVKAVCSFTNGDIKAAGKSRTDTSDDDLT